MEVYKPTKTQQLIFAGHHLNLDSPHSNMAFLFHLKENIICDLFIKALKSFISGCDAFSVEFTNIEELNFTKKTPQVEIIYDLKDIEEWTKEDINKPFDLNNRLYRAVIFMADSKIIGWYLNMHHLITDGWSFTLLQRRICEKYEQLLEHENLTLNSYPSFRAFLEMGKNDKLSEVKYWEQMIQKLPLPNPYFGKLFTTFSNRIKRYSCDLTEEKFKRLAEILDESAFKSWSLEQSLFNFFLSITSILVGRFCRTNDTVVGTPVHGRINLNQRNTVGPFLKLFPIKCTLESKDSFIDVYQKTKRESNEVIRNSMTIDSSSELNKRFNTVFNFITTRFYHSPAIPMEASWVNSGFNDPGHAVKVQVFNFNDEAVPRITIDLSEQIFDEQHQQLFIDSWNQLVDHVISSQGTVKINQLLEEDLQLINSFNDTQKELTTENTIVDEFLEIVNKYPHNQALLTDHELLSYKELDLLSNQVANFLSEKGLAKKAGRIGVCLDRSPELIVALLAIVKTGSAYVPIDTSLPKARIEQIYREAELSTLFIENESVVDRIVGINPLSVGEILKNNPSLNPINNSSPEDLFYIIYTSGSTGKPKGVMNRMSAVMNRLYWAKNYHNLDPNSDLVLQKTSIGFDVSVWELFLPLMSGTPLYLAKPGGQKDSNYLLNVIKSRNITIVHFVPSMLEVFLLTMKANDSLSLKQVICSGEALKLEHIRRFKELLPECTLHNLYGPTEAAIDVTAIQVNSGPEIITNVPIGKPIYNTQIRILNENKEQCSPGQEGDIYIGGAQIAEGYYNKPSLTKDKFIRIRQFENQMYYNTGDRGYWLRDGNIVYSGRSDFQVKIRGNRVELGEIEQVLLEMPQVKQASVLIVNAALQIIGAVVVPTKPVSESEILSFLEVRLPEYMVPSKIILQERIPVNISGKVDRKMLKELVKHDAKAQHPNEMKEPPSTEIELIVHDVWSEVLNVGEIGLHDSFYRIGGDSLTGIKIVVKINNVMDLELPVISILKEPTIYKFSKYIEKTLMKLLAE